MLHLDYFYRMFSIRITAGFVIPIRKSVGLLRNVKFSIPLGITTGMLCCIVKLPEFYNSSSSQKGFLLVYFKKINK